MTFKQPTDQTRGQEGFAQLLIARPNAFRTPEGFKKAGYNAVTDFYYSCYSPYDKALRMIGYIYWLHTRFLRFLCKIGFLWRIEGGSFIQALKNKQFFWNKP